MSKPNKKLHFTFRLKNGNIAELLLRDGFARCVDWSIALVTGGAEKLRSSEKAAKEKKLRIWKDYVQSTPTVYQLIDLFYTFSLKVNSDYFSAVECQG